MAWALRFRSGMFKVDVGNNEMTEIGGGTNTWFKGEESTLSCRYGVHDVWKILG